MPVEVLAHEAPLQLHRRARLGAVQQRVGEALVGGHHTLEQARHGLLRVLRLRPARAGARRGGHQSAHAGGGLLDHVGEVALGLLHFLLRAFRGSVAAVAAWGWLTCRGMCSP